MCDEFKNADGGLAYDPFEYALNKSLLLGKIFTIDVLNSNTSCDVLAVSLEQINSACPDLNMKIFAYGIRNPSGINWFNSSLSSNLSLIVPDVGEHFMEEVNLMIRAGDNYGWDLMEGILCVAEDPCPNVTNTNYQLIANQESVLPIAVLDHQLYGPAALIGGFLYQGPNTSTLFGQYLFTTWTIVGATNGSILEIYMLNMLNMTSVIPSVTTLSSCIGKSSPIVLTSDSKLQTIQSARIAHDFGNETFVALTNMVANEDYSIMLIAVNSDLGPVPGKAAMYQLQLNKR